MIRELLEVTPLPPVDGDIDALLAAWRDCCEARQAILARGTTVVDEADRPLLRELQLRDDAWQDALDEARRRVADQRTATQKLRCYAANL
jgi:hypothetical protein